MTVVWQDGTTSIEYHVAEFGSVADGADVDVLVNLDRAGWVLLWNSLTFHVEQAGDDISEIFVSYRGGGFGQAPGDVLGTQLRVVCSNRSGAARTVRGLLAIATRNSRGR